MSIFEYSDQKHRLSRDMHPHPCHRWRTLSHSVSRRQAHNDLMAMMALCSISLFENCALLPILGHLYPYPQLRIFVVFVHRKRMPKLRLLMKQEDEEEAVSCLF